MTADHFTRCSKCKQKKPASDFHKDKSRRTGLCSHCKACKKQYNDTRRERNTAIARAWNKANPSRVRAFQQRFHERHPNYEQHRSYESLRKKVEANKRRYYKDLDKSRAERRAHYAANSAACKKRASDWRQRNREKTRHYKSRRKARLCNAAGSHTLQEWLRLCSEAMYRCAICGTDKQPLTRDHIVPLSKGGSDWIENIQPLCRSCNSRKGAN